MKTDNKFKIVVSSLFLAGAVLFNPATIHAQYQPVVPSIQIGINKEVKNPLNNQFVDNLYSQTYSFLPGQNVEFKITVRNNGQTVIDNAAVSDKLPDYVDYVSGPGNYDANSKTVNFRVDHLNPGEAKSYSVVAVVMSQNKGGNVPSMCLTNYTQVNANGQMAQDSALFCIGEKVLGQVQELPVTGPEDTLLVLAGSISLLSASLVMFKKSVK